MFDKLLSNSFDFDNFKGVCYNQNNLYLWLKRGMCSENSFRAKKN